MRTQVEIVADLEDFRLGNLAVMERSTGPNSKTTKQRWLGRVLTGVVVLFLLLDGAMKLVRPAPVLEAFARLDYPVDSAFGIGALLLLCLALFVIPRTVCIGAVLLTGFLGGAVSTHVRIRDPWLTHTLFPLYIGGLIWGGLLLRDSRLRAFLLHRN